MLIAELQKKLIEKIVKQVMQDCSKIFTVLSE